MTTIPTPTTVAANSAAKSADFNSHATAINFWAQPPACRVHLTADLTTGWTAGTPAPIPWAAESFDQVPSGASPMHSTTTNTSRLTIQVAGLYAVRYGLIVNPGSTAQLVKAYIAKNGAEYGCESEFSLSGYFSLVGSDLVECAAGDYLEIYLNWASTPGTLYYDNAAAGFSAILVSQ